MIPDAPRHPSPELIRRAVCVACGVTEHDFLTNGRSFRVVTARTLAVGIARERTMLSYPEIQRRIMGRTSHSTSVTMKHRFDELVAAPALLAAASKIIDVALETPTRPLVRA